MTEQTAPQTPAANGTHEFQPGDGPGPSARRLLAGPGLTLVGFSFRAGQVLDEHKAPGPILVSCVSGRIDLEVTGGEAQGAHRLEPGSTVYIAGGDPHRLTALEDSVVHVTLHRNL
ncbi:MAG TPA: cupin domain-containing protein [Nocardia sp.]|uniref:cupin domain-containing protein n=1 Tax=Nocardia TaxID=1817 RepID=UPI0024540D40|nr:MULTISPECIES: cupin domain-containing protein [Nocardia]HLS76356.1 cupin domain-containing protein [Nocardia sp.]